MDRFDKVVVCKTFLFKVHCYVNLSIRMQPFVREIYSQKHDLPINFILKLNLYLQVNVRKTETTHMQPPHLKKIAESTVITIITLTANQIPPELEHLKQQTTKRQHAYKN